MTNKVDEPNITRPVDAPSAPAVDCAVCRSPKFQARNTALAMIPAPAHQDQRRGDRNAAKTPTLKYFSATERNNAPPPSARRTGVARLVTENAASPAVAKARIRMSNCPRSTSSSAGGVIAAKVSAARNAMSPSGERDQLRATVRARNQMLVT